MQGRRQDIPASDIANSISSATVGSSGSGTDLRIGLDHGVWRSTMSDFLFFMLTIRPPSMQPCEAQAWFRETAPFSAPRSKRVNSSKLAPKSPYNTSSMHDRDGNVWHVPAEPDRRQEAFDETRRLPRLHAEQYCQCWSGLNRTKSSAIQLAASGLSPESPADCSAATKASPALAYLELLSHLFETAVARRI